MLPDKIYIHEASVPELAEPALKEYHIEYIRKDALLEWLDENMKKRSDECDESILSTGYYNAFWLVKEYINSL